MWYDAGVVMNDHSMYGTQLQYILIKYTKKSAENIEALKNHPPRLPLPPFYTSKMQLCVAISAIIE